MNIPGFHHFLFFYVSQGSVATYVRCDGENDEYFIANFLLNPTVKEFYKSRPAFGKVINGNMSLVFFDPQ